MADGGPYGITQFDAAGVIGNYQAMQHNRIQMMLEQKQLERLDKQSKNEDAASRAVQTYYGGNASPASPDASGGGQTPSSGQTATPTSTGAPAAPTGQPSAADRQKLISTLMATDPQRATQFMEAFQKMDKDQVDQFNQHNDQIMQMMGGLLQLPAAQRPAAIQQMAPQLQQLGYTPQQLQGFDPSDQNLRKELVSHMDAGKIAEFVQPKINAVTQGGSLISTDATGQSKTVYESPTVAGPGGEPFVRPPAMSSTMPTVSTPQEAAKLPPGTKFRLPDGRIGTVPGGTGGNASGGFQ